MSTVLAVLGIVAGLFVVGILPFLLIGWGRTPAEKRRIHELAELEAMISDE